MKFCRKGKLFQTGEKNGPFTPPAMVAHKLSAPTSLRTNSLILSHHCLRSSTVWSATKTSKQTAHYTEVCGCCQNIVWASFFYLPYITATTTYLISDVMMYPASTAYHWLGRKRTRGTFVMSQYKVSYTRCYGRGEVLGVSLLFVIEVTHYVQCSVFLKVNSARNVGTPRCFCCVISPPPPQKILFPDIASST